MKSRGHRPRAFLCFIKACSFLQDTTGLLSLAGGRYLTYTIFIHSDKSALYELVVSYSCVAAPPALRKVWEICFEVVSVFTEYQAISALIFSVEIWCPRSRRQHPKFTAIIIIIIKINNYNYIYNYNNIHNFGECITNLRQVYHTNWFAKRTLKMAGRQKKKQGKIEEKIQSEIGVCRT